VLLARKFVFGGQESTLREPCSVEYESVVGMLLLKPEPRDFGIYCGIMLAFVIKNVNFLCVKPLSFIIFAVIFLRLQISYAVQ
jgi:hypothetical protein